MRVLLAFRAFFQALWSATTAERIEQAMRQESLPAPKASVEPDSKAVPVSGEPSRPPVKSPPPSPRSEALTLLAALQREARFVDLVKEPLDQYEDAQIGAAAREVLRDCHVVLERMFALQPLSADSEGSEVEVPPGYPPLQFRLSGNVTGDPPYRGKLVHPGWVATKCDLPEWTGDHSSSQVVAPQEVELSA
jgi:hypothetical protein